MKNMSILTHTQTQGCGKNNNIHSTEISCYNRVFILPNNPKESWIQGPKQSPIKTKTQNT
jgi:hypothetical protein